MSPSARKLIAMPLTIWSARRWIDEEGVERAPAAPPARIATSEAERSTSPSLSAARIAEERAHQHHPLEADVHDAGALREHAAERGEDERRRVAEHRGEERRPDDDGLELPDARAGREVAEPEARAPPPRSRTSRRAARRARSTTIPASGGEEREQRGSRATSAPRSAAARPKAASRPRTIPAHASARGAGSGSGPRGQARRSSQRHPPPRASRADEPQHRRGRRRRTGRRAPGSSG